MSVSTFRATRLMSEVIDQLFSQFNRMLEKKRIIARKGSIVDATFVDAPLLYIWTFFFLSVSHQL